MATQVFKDLLIEWGPDNLTDGSLGIFEEITHTEEDSTAADKEMVVSMLVLVHPGLALNDETTKRGILEVLFKDMQEGQTSTRMWLVPCIRNEVGGPGSTAERLVSLLNRVHDEKIDLEDIKKEVDGRVRSFLRSEAALEVALGGLFLGPRDTVSRPEIC